MQSPADPSFAFAFVPAAHRLACRALALFFIHRIYQDRFASASIIFTVGICIKSTNLLKAMRRFWDFVTNAYAEITSAMTPKLIEIRHNLSQDILARKKDPCQGKALQVVQLHYAVYVRRT